MSRSKRGGKAPGWEFWSRRPYSNASGSGPGKQAKKMTHKAERRAAKKETKKPVED